MQAIDFVKGIEGRGVTINADGKRLAIRAIAQNGGTKAAAEKAQLSQGTIHRIKSDGVFTLESWETFYNKLIVPQPAKVA